MGPKLAGFLLSFLLVLPVKGTDLSRNGTSPEDARGLRANKRVVRLYSGTRPKPIVCEGEGFQADPTDCTIFHRCMKNGNGRYVSFRFQCGPGTIYDSDKEICNYPQNTKRTECGANIHIPSVEYTFDNEISRELPSPLSNKHPESAEKITIKNEFSMQTTKSPDISSFLSKYPWITTSQRDSNPAISISNQSINQHQQTKSPKASSIKREIIASDYSTTPLSISQQTFFSTTEKIHFQNLGSPQTGDICKSNGFMGDSENCRKFYRCISNQRGGFIRYEFLCSDPTIWDDDKQACNHVWAVKRRSCGRGSLVDYSNENRKNKQETSSEFTTTSKTTNFPAQSQLQINYGAKVTQTQTQIGDGSVIQNQTQINFGNKKDGEPEEIVQNQTQIIYGDAVSQTQTQINYGDEAVQTQVQIDHSKESSQAQTQVTQFSSTTKTTQFIEHQPLSTTSSNNGCTESGFKGDTEDCKKFYRCVDNGSGSFSRYDFSCGDGTEWDPKLEACNHAWAVKECGGKGTVETTSQSPTKPTQSTNNVPESASTVSTPTTISTTTTTTESYYLSTEQESEDNNDIPYGNQPSSPVTNRPIEHIPHKDPQSPNENKCRSSGFMGDSKDCKKFYRCVDNGNRGYTRYEFTCGEGTVWDYKIEACNHAWAVQNCGGNANSETHTEKSTTANVVHTTSTQTSSQTPPQNDDYDTGYGQQSQHDEPTSSIVTTTVKSISTTLQSLSTSDFGVGNTCTSGGFIGDSNNCKKFYRCVDNGYGGFTRYEFSCGEGTVWDPKIQACNHAWAVEKCGGNSDADINKIETTTQKDTEIYYSSTTQAYKPDNNTDTGYGQPNQETHSTSSAASYLENLNLKCTTSGFMSDLNDCKKFYRCVDNGDGTFTRYEFSCGEGTVWDSKIDSCNHAWAVEKCGGSSTSTTTGPTQPINNEDNYDTYPIQNDKYPNQTTLSTTSSTTTSSPNKDNVCKKSGFTSDSQDCKKFYRCVENGHGGYIRYEFGCGEGTVWDQSIEACNHPWAVSGRCSGSGSYNNSSIIQPTTQPYTTSSEIEGEDHGYDKPTTQKTTSTSFISKPSDNKCTQEGFYGNQNNCKNFYRCVDNGQGSFIIYEFSCGEGTVWNQDIQACDHESSNIQCNMHAVESTTKKPNSEQDEMVTESTTKISESSTANEEITYTSSRPQFSSNECKTEGFYGNPNDCKKFYRCVDNGKGDFTKFDFSCGDGTVWDQEILACNHENSNNKCSDGAASFTTTKVTPETVSGSLATTEGTQITQRPSTTSTGSGGEQCTMEGFFGNTNDCRKFYRCVDNGKGSFTKYDFVCGEGTVWVQEIQACDYDNGISSCSNKESSSKPQTIEDQLSTAASSSSNQAITESQSSEKEDDEYPSQSQPLITGEKCTSEGFFGDKNDCTRFYRCVDNGQGGYTKYDFTCGEGTAWDSNIQTCNHINEVESCQNTNEENESTPSQDKVSSQTTESSSTTKETTSKPATSNDKCKEEGYFGNTKDCTMFYRCVDNGKGGYTKYDFTCGEGTIWDQDLTTCNHPQDVTNPSCKNGQDGHSSQHSSSTESSSLTSTSSTTSQSSPETESSNQGTSNCSQESSSKKPGSQKVKCEKAGFYADPDDCKKFYRCVDWDGDGKRFSVYHFDCGEGTIWDPQLETCNHEDSVYPPRDCSGTQSQTGNVTQETTSSTTTTTTEQSTSSEQTPTKETTTAAQSTTEESTTQQSSSSEHTTQQATTTAKTTTQEPSTSKQTTTEKTTTTQQSTSSEKTTTEQSTTSEKTTTLLTTGDQTTTEQATTNLQQTTQETAASQQTTSSESTTTEQATTSELTTTQQSTTTEQSTQQTTTSEQTTQSSSSEQTTTQQSSNTEESSTDSTSTEQQSTTTEKFSTTTEQLSEQNTTEEQTITEQEKTTTESATPITTTESNESTTESSQSTTSQETVSPEKDCPETEDDQYLYVCPTSFKRHPKYCNMFYQCTEDNDSHDVKITMFKCPNNTIYDESKTQCVEEDKSDKKCAGQTAQRHRVKRLNSNFKEPIEAGRSKLTCSTVGYYPFETDNECSGIFLKCETSKSGKLRGYVYRCPEGYTYWSISKRCEKKEYMKGCKTSDRSWRDRWEIPVEKKNIAKQ